MSPSFVADSVIIDHIKGLVANHNGPPVGDKAYQSLAEKGRHLVGEWKGLDPTERPSIEDYLQDHLNSGDVCSAIERHQRPYS